MSDLTTKCIEITQEPEAGQLKQKLNAGQNSEVLKIYKLVLERVSDETRAMLFLSLYMSGKLASAHGGTSSLIPQLRGDDVLGEHGMRMTMSRVSLKKEKLADVLPSFRKLSPEEVAVIREARRTLLKQDE